MTLESFSVNRAAAIVIIIKEKRAESSDLGEISGKLGQIWEKRAERFRRNTGNDFDFIKRTHNLVIHFISNRNVFGTVI